MKQGFYAYSSFPAYCEECIEEAIEKINSSYEGLVKIKSWQELKSTGRLIINEVLSEIDSCDFFCADLTGMSDNVIFELGYAIAKKKVIWITLDLTNIETSKRFHELNLFTTIGYRKYTNSQTLVKSFSEDEIYKSDFHLYNSLTKNLDIKQGENALFYIKSQIDTNYSTDITNEIEFFKLPYLLDDPIETKVHPITWYIEKIFSVPACLIEFSSTHRFGNELHNSKCAFISGFSVGLGIKTLMVSEKPYTSPIDFRELLQKYSTRKECQESVGPFLKEIHNEIAQLILKRRSLSSNLREISELQKINFGEFIAEHEISGLEDYYIETASTQNLVKSEHNIIIGRKGSGKTATLYHLKQILDSDVRNHVCLIKPINFEIDGLISLYNKLEDEFEKGYIIESIWKFLIYSEIAKSLYARTRERPLYSKNHSDFEFESFVESNKNIILTDFSTRIEQEIESLLGINENSQGNFRIKVSEILHETILTELKQHIVNIINKSGKLVILIDNLDKSWKKDSNLEIMSKFILGLLGVVGRVTKEFKAHKNNDYKFTFHLSLFLRSDIFKYIMKTAREPDKIEYSRLSWNDSQTLLRIIEARFEVLTPLNVKAEDLWEKFLPPNVECILTKEYILGNIFPRPRDLIFFLTSAKNIAVSRGHKRIQDSDLISAYKEYSNWVFKSIIVENGISIKQMEDFMYNLMGESRILTKESIRGFANSSGILIEEDVNLEKFISHLTSLTILGSETRDNYFEYEYEFDSDIKIKALAKKINSGRYKIHNALIPYLELKD